MNLPTGWREGRAGVHCRMWANSPHLKTALRKPAEEQAWPAVRRDAQNQTDFESHVAHTGRLSRILCTSRLTFCIALPLGFSVHATGFPASLMPQWLQQDSPTLDSWTPGLLQTQFPGLTAWHGPLGSGVHVQLLVRVLRHGLGALQGSSNTVGFGLGSCYVSCWRDSSTVEPLVEDLFLFMGGPPMVPPHPPLLAPGPPGMVGWGL